jgi:hypothetical protein
VAQGPQVPTMTQRLTQYEYTPSVGAGTPRGAPASRRQRHAHAARAAIDVPLVGVEIWHV